MKQDTSRSASALSVSSAERTVRLNHACGVAAASNPPRRRLVHPEIVAFNARRDDRRVDEERRATETRFEALARLVPVGLFRRDPAGAHRYVNEAWCAITGVSAAEALGSSATPHLCADERERVQVAWERAIAAETPLALEYRIEHADGVIIRLCEQAVVERDDTGRMLGYVGTITDVTDRHQAEGDRQDLVPAGVQATSAKDEFLATLSHELRSPLCSLLLWMGLLRKGNLTDATLASAVAAIERNAQLMSRLVEDLVDVARVDSGNLGIQTTRVDLQALVAAAVEGLRPAAAAKGLALEAWFDWRKMTVRADPLRLHQVLNNLITNAIKFTPEGGRIAVDLTALIPARRAARLTVSDTGIGIAPDFVPRVFERFQQADTTSARPHDGLGLGLWIVRDLVERHGGTIAVDSPGLGEGATFSMTLPLWVEGQADGRSAASARVT